MHPWHHAPDRLETISINDSNQLIINDLPCRFTCAPADLDENLSGREAIERPTATHRGRRLSHLAASRFRPLVLCIDSVARREHEADMIGVATDRYGVGSAEFLGWSADDQLKPGIVAQDRETVCATCFDLGQAERGDKNIPGRGDIGNVQI